MVELLPSSNSFMLETRAAAIVCKGTFIWNRNTIIVTQGADFLFSRIISPDITEITETI
jgi:hypothetical protein